jgi:hypothetical protein
MRVGWLVSVTGIFGAVRECVEISNTLVRLGYDVTIFSEDGAPITWLHYIGKVGTFAQAATAQLDVLILLCDWHRRYLDAFKVCSPKLRCVTVMGFDPSPELAQGLRADGAMVHDPAVMREAITMPGALVLADSSWQSAWLTANVGVTCGPAIGGVNLKQFYPVQGRRALEPYRILATGDPRARKGSDVVAAAVKILQAKKLPVEFVTYWNTRLPQDQMAKWYSHGDVFLDAEKRAGWCNPVAEAMACGQACVTTDIGAVHDFAIDQETALLVPVDDPEAMARAVIVLLSHPERRAAMAKAGAEKMRQFSYEIVGKRLADALEERLNA